MLSLLLFCCAVIAPTTFLLQKQFCSRVNSFQRLFCSKHDFVPAFALIVGQIIAVFLSATELLPNRVHVSNLREQKCFGTTPVFRSKTFVNFADTTDILLEGLS